MREVSPLKLDHFGRGIVYVDGKITFISHALPLEIVRIHLQKEKKKYNLAKVDKIIKESPNRKKVDCPYFQQYCGGCQLRHLKKEQQWEFKVMRAKELLDKNAKIRVDDISLLKGEDCYYRNKVVLHIQEEDFGLFQEGSNKLIPITSCKLLDESILSYFPLLKKLLKEPHQLTSVMIRCGVNTKQLMMAFIGQVEEEKLVSLFFPKVTTMLVNDKILWGNGTIQEQILGKCFFLSKDSFFQVNSKQVEVLYQEALAPLRKKKIHTLLDLYSGTGTIGILASDFVERVIGIEVVESAVRDARENAKLNKIENIEFFCGKVEDVLDVSFPKVDAVIVDPPRAGLDPKTKKTLISLAPSFLIYISCDMATLTRDLKELLPYYTLTKLSLIEIFPHTYHTESVCVLNRR